MISILRSEVECKQAVINTLIQDNSDLDPQLAGSDKKTKKKNQEVES